MSKQATKKKKRKEENLLKRNEEIVLSFIIRFSQLFTAFCYIYVFSMQASTILFYRKA